MQAMLLFDSSFSILYLNTSLRTIFQTFATSNTDVCYVIAFERNLSVSNGIAFSLTYTQYIAMMVLWEKKAVTVKELGKCLYLDSGTLTPLLKKLEEKNYVVRNRSKEDERNLIVSITKAGEDLKEQAVNIPMELGACVNVEPQEAQQLQKLLYKLLNGLS